MTLLAASPGLERAPEYWIGRFQAMASPCEVLVDTQDRDLAARVLATVSWCAQRIEQKFSRYRDDNIVHAINTSEGRPVEVDAETAQLLDFAASLHQLSDGRFDITSGVLRRAWRFDGGNRVPQASQLQELTRLVGWSKVNWDPPVLTLQPGMQIDFGGFGKEYAVDQAVGLVRALTSTGCLVNFGGDLAITAPRERERPWQVGVESAADGGKSAITHIELAAGALATSGDTYRHVTHEGRRLGHILDPRTGWPIADAPRCVTVAADTCLQAGMFTTMAVLRGADAERFLAAEGVRYWVQR